MAQVSFLILKEDPGKSTRLVSLDQKETERLFELLQTHTRHLQSEISICPKNQKPCSDFSSECSLTRIRSFSTPRVVVELHCERLSQWVLNSLLGLNSIQSSPIEPEKR